MKKMSNSPPNCLYDDDTTMSLTNSTATLESFSTPPSCGLTAKELQSGNVSSGGISISPSTPKLWETNYEGYLSEHRHGNINGSAKDNGMILPDIGTLQEPNNIGILHRELEKKNSNGELDAPSRGNNFMNKNVEKIINEQSASTSDKAVHNGKMFKSIFAKKNRKSSLDPLDLSCHGIRKFDDVLDQTTSNSRSRSYNSFENSLSNRMGKANPNDVFAMKGGSVRGGSLFGPKGTVIGPGGEVRNIKGNLGFGIKRRDSEKERKLKFTEMHNSRTTAVDSASSYLGEDKSVHYGQNFVNISQSGLGSSPNEYTRSQRPQILTPVNEDGALSKNRILKSIKGVESWSKNGDSGNLIVPAIMAMSPQVTFSFVEEVEKSQKEYTSAFGKYTLGKAREVGSKSSVLSIFVLRQNYLFEFDESDNSRPRGSLFLHNADVCIVDDTIQVEYHEKSKMQRKKMKKILLSVEPNDAGERRRWVDRLQEAANLRIDNLYDYDASDGGKELGKGAYSTIRPARRRRTQADQPISLDDNTSERNNGIMKKTPSFSSLSIFSSVPSVLSENQYECALKIVDKASFWERVRKGKERVDAIVREIAVQATLMTYDGSAHNSLRILSFFETFDHIVLELELSQGNDLFQHISSRGTLSETEAANIMFDLLTCITVMNSAGVVHRDLKPANILMGNFETDNKVMVGDFGMATFVGVDNLVYGRCGTPGYVAPEILMAGKNEGYSYNVDIFSAGVTLYVLLCGYEPFYGKTDKELIKDNKEAKVEYPESEWNTVSIEGRDLIEKMLERDPKKRITASEALRHAWITRRASTIRNDRPQEYSPGDIACSIN